MKHVPLYSLHKLKHIRGQIHKLSYKNFHWFSPPSFLNDTVTILEIPPPLALCNEFYIRSCQALSHTNFPTVPIQFMSSFILWISTGFNLISVVMLFLLWFANKKDCLVYIWYYSIHWLLSCSTLSKRI